MMTSQYWNGGPEFQNSQERVYPEWDIIRGSLFWNIFFFLHDITETMTIIILKGWKLRVKKPNKIRINEKNSDHLNSEPIS